MIDQTKNRRIWSICLAIFLAGPWSSCQTRTSSDSSDSSKKNQPPISNQDSNSPLNYASCYSRNSPQNEHCLEWSSKIRYEDQHVAIMKKECDNNKGQLTVNLKCPRERNIGGCTQGGNDKDSLTNLVWFYYEGTSMKAERIPQFCAAQKEEFVSP
ncbi:MAG: hypothetical protein NT027_11775 [Proteobacteria bacterium]|nr:hypothetical protein [Pseudomonadota bacterium]